jgi:hypothetical protein
MLLMLSSTWRKSSPVELVTNYNLSCAYTGYLIHLIYQLRVHQLHICTLAAKEIDVIIVCDARMGENNKPALRWS